LLNGLDREVRTVVTINKMLFMHLAKLSIAHPGILVIPSGGTREEQFAYVMAAITWAGSTNYPGSVRTPVDGSAFANRCVDVSVALDITFEDVTMLAQPGGKEQKLLS
jgi:hypothetical protein